MVKTPQWWTTKVHPLAILLFPLSLIFGSVVFLRRKAYQYQIFKSYKAPVPVIIIGNISVGGTGKTPLLINLVQQLQHQKINVGVISRGYGGTYQTETLLVNEHTNVKLSGDEALLIAQQTNVPLVVGKSRQEAVKALLKIAKIDCILADDGLQHYALQRDLEIVVINHQKRFGNQLLLPAGSLREPLSRLKTVDALISQDPQLDNEYKMMLKTVSFVNLKTNQHQPITFFKDQKVIALAGIGNPEKFYQTLESIDLHISQKVDFADHANFTLEDISFKQDLPIIMTAKDAVKCASFATEQHWYLEIKMQASEQFMTWFMVQIKKLIDKR